MNITKQYVSLNALNREEWQEWAARCGSNRKN